jgi:hypothetical protein|eukprot:COSAG02_NODE_19935_length_857_cov_1.149077_1_plen_90_part_00
MELVHDVVYRHQWRCLRLRLNRWLGLLQLQPKLREQNLKIREIADKVPRLMMVYQCIVLGLPLLSSACHCSRYGMTSACATFGGEVFSS